MESQDALTRRTPETPGVQKGDRLQDGMARQHASAVQVDPSLRADLCMDVWPKRPRVGADVKPAGLVETRLPWSSWPWQRKGMGSRI